MNAILRFDLLELLPTQVLAAGNDPLGHVLDHSYGLPLGLTKHALLLITSLCLCLTIFPAVAKRIESGKLGVFGGLFEALLLFIRDDVARPFLGKDAERFLPVIWTFFFFILFCNVLGLVPGLASATGNISVTITLALYAFAIYHFCGIRENGFVHYVKANLLVGPPPLWPLMILLEIVGHIIKPAALAIRLWANMVGGHVMLTVIIGFTGVMTADNLVGGGLIALVAGGSGVLLNLLELLVAIIQAFIFTFLTTVFLSMALHPDH